MIERAILRRLAGLPPALGWRGNLAGSLDNNASVVWLVNGNQNF